MQSSARYAVANPFKHLKTVEVWRSGSALVSINEVNLHRARLVLRLVTVSGFDSRAEASLYFGT